MSIITNLRRWYSIILIPQGRYSQSNMSCCPPDSWPCLKADASYTPLGIVSTLPITGKTPLPVYTVSPKTPTKKGVLILPEIYGWGGRLKAICDTFAGEGYYVIMLDTHRGDVATDTTDVLSWVQSNSGWDDILKHDFEAVMNKFKEEGITNVGAVGFCWGAWAWAKASASGVALDVCVAAHPSVKLEEYAFKSSQLTMMEAVSCPYLFLTAGNDDEKCKPGGDLVLANGTAKVFSDMMHGWVTRGDLSDEEVKRDVKEAMKLITEFVKKHL